jgi:MoxR-like ATPase
VLLKTMEPALAVGRLAELQRAVPQIHVSAALLDYGQSLIAASRSSPVLLHGLSPRAGLALLRAARAWALIQGRQAVIPEDLQTIFPATVGHRLSGVDEGEPLGGDDLARRLIQSVPIP